MKNVINHYNRKGEYTGSSVSCPWWLTPDGFRLIFGTPFAILVFCITPLITLTGLIGTAVYVRKMKAKGRRVERIRPSWSTIAYTVTFNLMWIFWFFFIVLGYSPV